MKKIKIISVENADGGVPMQEYLTQIINNMLNDGWDFIPPIVVSPAVPNCTGYNTNGGFILATFEKEV